MPGYHPAHLRGLQSTSTRAQSRSISEHLLPLHSPCHLLEHTHSPPRRTDPASHGEGPTRPAGPPAGHLSPQSRPPQRLDGPQPHRSDFPAPCQGRPSNHPSRQKHRGAPAGSLLASSAPPRSRRGCLPRRPSAAPACALPCLRSPFSARRGPTHPGRRPRFHPHPRQQGLRGQERCPLLPRHASGEPWAVCFGTPDLSPRTEHRAAGQAVPPALSWKLRALPSTC
mmetsp:Transcript_601/g.2305  ORF Transcript_601/g.2305 Transcript_601/m.2305 type:complete len:226 (-) Transcript_601:214-891(-)